MKTDPAHPRIVILGGGFAGLEAAFHLRKRLGKRATIALVSESAHFLFKPNLVYVPFGKEPERFVMPIAPVLDRRHIFFVHDRVERVDPAAQMVHATGRDLSYDHLIIATGAAMRSAEIPGLGERARAIWTPGDLTRLGHSFAHVLERAAGGGRSRVLFLLPPGNRCPGPLYEIALMLDTWLRRHEARAAVDVTVATAESAFIAPFGPRLHETLARAFAGRDVAARTGRVVVGVEDGQARFADDSVEPFDLLVTFPPHVASVRYGGLPHDEHGFLRTDRRTCQVEGHPEVYAVGDAADFPVKQAFVAMLQAAAAAEHLAERLLGEPSTAAFDPMSVLIIDQLDTATFAQAPLRVSGDSAVLREDAPELYKIGTGELWRAGKRLIGQVLPQRFRMGQPFHAGATWSVMEAGLKVMASAFAD
jgi:NADH dehydrogenase FAD-containing subunit